MKLERSFEVRAPIDRVWAALIDVERVAPCLPGAEITESGEDGTYRGNFTVKLGPTTASYRGELSLESVEEGSRTVTMRASGQDKRGQGSAKATIVSVLRERDGVTTVDASTDFTITGRLARFGRGGMIKGVSARLMRDFSDCLAQAIEAEPAAEGPAPTGPRPDASTGAPRVPAPSSAPDPPQPSSAPRPAPAATAKPVRAFSLFLAVLWRRVGRLFGRG